ncbi:MAG: integrase, partial [Thermoprotei archaeon]
REDVKKAIGLFPANIEFRWDSDFENFLAKEKRRKKIRRQDTIEYYKKLFKENLEGKQLTPELVDFVVKHRNKWLRNIFRHYIQYLYHKRKIPLETFGWVMEVVPARTYEDKVKIFRIDLDLLRKTMEFLKQRHELYYLYYLLMYFSGIRLEHVVRLVAEYRPEEVVYVDMMDEYTQRLVCFEKFCRYYLGYKGGKPCDWVYFPKELVELLERYGGTKRDRSKVSDYARYHNLLRPKYLRKLHWQIGKKVVRDKDVLRFIQSRFGELKISEERYADLLSDADEEYPRLAEALRRGLEDTEYLKHLLLNKRAKKNRSPAHGSSS